LAKFHRRESTDTAIGVPVWWSPSTILAPGLSLGRTTAINTVKCCAFSNAHARQAGLLTFDTFDRLDPVVRPDGRNIAYGKAPDVHHNAFGNRLVADALARELPQSASR
jgi:hypothetical protein